jgi:hypothetical protein
MSKTHDNEFWSSMYSFADDNNLISSSETDFDHIGKAESALKCFTNFCSEFSLKLTPQKPFLRSLKEQEIKKEQISAFN